MAVDWGGLIESTENYYNELIDRVQSSTLSGPSPTSELLTAAGTPASALGSPTRTAPHNQQSFDTIGQVIYRTIGNCRVPLRILWEQSIEQPLEPRVGNVFEGQETPEGATIIGVAAGDVEGPIEGQVGVDVQGVAGVINIAANGAYIYHYTQGLYAFDKFTYTVMWTVKWTVMGSDGSEYTYEETNYLTSQIIIPPVIKPPISNFAAALCSQIDPDEEGGFVSITLNNRLIWHWRTGVSIPAGMDPVIAALLTFSLNNLLSYPGDEAQLPCPLIVADMGEEKTNAFRGIKYVVFPSYPVQCGIENIAIQWARVNEIVTRLPVLRQPPVIVPAPRRHRKIITAYVIVPYLSDDGYNGSWQGGTLNAGIDPQEAAQQAAQIIANWDQWSEPGGDQTYIGSNGIVASYGDGSFDIAYTYWEWVDYDPTIPEEKYVTDPDEYYDPRAPKFIAQAAVLLTASAQRWANGNMLFSAAVGFIADASHTTEAVALLSASSDLQADSEWKPGIKAILAAEGIITANAAHTPTSSARFSATGQLSVEATVKGYQYGSARMAAQVAVMVDAGETIHAVWQGAALFAAIGSVIVDGAATHGGEALLIAAGALAADASLTHALWQAEAKLEAIGSVSVETEIIEAIINASALLDGHGSLSADALNLGFTWEGAALLAAEGFLAAQARLPMLRQEQFRFRVDADPVNNAPVWGAPINTNLYPRGNITFRIRISVGNRSDTATGSLPWQLMVSRNGGSFTPVTTTSQVVHSADASASADDAEITTQELLGEA